MTSTTSQRCCLCSMAVNALAGLMFLGNGRGGRALLCGLVALLLLSFVAYMDRYKGEIQ